MARRLRRTDPHRAHFIYYGIMVCYCVWGLLALGLTPDPLILAILGSSLGNIGLAISALHVIYVNRRLLPKPAQPPRVLEWMLVGAALFFLGISALAFQQRWRALGAG